MPVALAVKKGLDCLPSQWHGYLLVDEEEEVAMHTPIAAADGIIAALGDLLTGNEAHP